MAMGSFTPNNESSINSKLIIKIAIADDHGIVRGGIRALLEETFCIVGEAIDGVEALQLV